MLRASFWTSLLLRSSSFLSLFIAILLARSPGTALQSHSVFFCQETCYLFALPMWFSVVLLGYFHELLAFHVGLFLKPKYLLNSVETDPLIVFTLTHRDRVKTSTPLPVFLYQRKKHYPADIDCLQNDPQKLSLYLSLYGTPKLPCASGSWHALEDIVSGFISWSTVTPWHGWQCLIYVSSVLSRLGNHGYNC